MLTWPILAWRLWLQERLHQLQLFLATGRTVSREQVQGNSTIFFWRRPKIWGEGKVRFTSISRDRFLRFLVLVDMSFESLVEVASWWCCCWWWWWCCCCCCCCCGGGGGGGRRCRHRHYFAVSWTAIVHRELTFWAAVLGKQIQFEELLAQLLRETSNVLPMLTSWVGVLKHTEGASTIGHPKQSLHIHVH